MTETDTPKWTKGLDPVDVHIGRRIRARREELGQTQDQLARAIDVTFQQVQKYERGVNRVSCARLVLISMAQDTPVAWYFEGLAGAFAEGQANNPAIQSATDWLGTNEALNFAMTVGALPAKARSASLAMIMWAVLLHKMGVEGAEAPQQELVP